MTIELIIDPSEKVFLKEDLLLNKLHKHYILCLEIEGKTSNYTIKSVKKVVFCGIKNNQEIYTITHLLPEKYYKYKIIIDDWNKKNKTSELLYKYNKIKQLNK